MEKVNVNWTIFENPLLTDFGLKKKHLHIFFRSSQWLSLHFLSQIRLLFLLLSLTSFAASARGVAIGNDRFSAGLGVYFLLTAVDSCDWNCNRPFEFLKNTFFFLSLLSKVWPLFPLLLRVCSLQWRFCSRHFHLIFTRNAKGFECQRTVWFVWNRVKDNLLFFLLQIPLRLQVFWYDQVTEWWNAISSVCTSADLSFGSRMKLLEIETNHSVVQLDWTWEKNGWNEAMNIHNLNDLLCRPKPWAACYSSKYASSWTCWNRIISAWNTRARTTRDTGSTWRSRSTAKWASPCQTRCSASASNSTRQIRHNWKRNLRVTSFACKSNRTWPLGSSSAMIKRLPSSLRTSFKVNVAVSRVNRTNHSCN